mmetsp:Transcript_45381/g.82922  ORF Transcript_45381/g.82922 Transcript_45381/m.82922 type:complete len:232 (+) Transcript_45381:1278-1973(+)
MVPGDHLDANMCTLNLVNGLSCVFTRWIHDWQDACKLHPAVAFGEGDAKRLEAGLAKLCIFVESHLADVVKIIDLPLHSLILCFRRQHDINHSLGDLHWPAVDGHADNGSLHNWVEAKEFLHGVLLLKLSNCVIHRMRALALDRLSICPQHCGINGVVLVGCIRCQGCILKHLLCLHVAECWGLGVIVDGHLRGGQCTCLVGAQHLHGCNLFQSCQVCDNASLISHLLGSN